MMLNKIKRAARRGKIEQAINALLKADPLGQHATLTIRDADEDVALTLVLKEDIPADREAVQALEQRLLALDGVKSATIVATAHNVAKDDARRQSGHDNPLSIPGKRGANATGAAPKGRQRPGGAKRVIAVASGKGGVGKSTLSAQIAMALAAKGHKVGLLDLDIYGPSIPVLFGLQGQKPTVEDSRITPLQAAGLSLMSIGFLADEEKAIAWRGPMVMGAAKQLLEDVAWPELDYLVIDTPPGTGDTHLTLLQRTTLDGAVIVSTPSPLALADVKRGVSLFTQMGVPLLGFVENMAHLADGSRPFGEGLDEDVLIELGLPRLGTLPLDPALARISPNTEQTAFSNLAEALEARLSVLDHGDNAP